MPLSVMEAMAKGLPVVATAVSGVPEELGDTGQLLSDPTQDAEATVRELVATLKDWASSKDLRDSIGQTGRVRAMALFQQERMLDEYRETVVEVRSQQTEEDSYSKGSDTACSSQKAAMTVQQVWQIESTFRYASWMWMAWSRYVVGDFTGMDSALEQVLLLSYKPKSWPILEWGRWFARFCDERGVIFDGSDLVHSKVCTRLTRSRIARTAS